MAFVQTSPGLICVTHRSLPSRTSRAMTPHDSRVSRRGSSLVGRRGAVLTSVPKKTVPDSASNEGVLQTLLVAGPKWKTWSPQLSVIVIGGSRGSGLGPASHFPPPPAGFTFRAPTNTPPAPPPVPGASAPAPPT